VGIIEGFRWALLGRASAPGLQVAISALGTLALLASGLVYFKRMEATFADVV
jgi:lipopolysaccharide transport system permease protein